MSVSVNIDVAGAGEFASALECFDSAMKRQIQEQLTGWSQNVKNLAARLVPVRTGYLQSSIMVQVKDWQTEIGAEASYAAAVEFGTRTMQAQPYLAPAVEANLPSLEQILTNAISLAKSEAQV